MFVHTCKCMCAHVYFQFRRRVGLGTSLLPPPLLPLSFLLSAGVLAVVGMKGRIVLWRHLMSVVCLFVCFCVCVHVCFFVSAWWRKGGEINYFSRVWYYRWHGLSGQGGYRQLICTERGKATPLATSLWLKACLLCTCKACGLV